MFDEPVNPSGAGEAPNLDKLKKKSKTSTPALDMFGKDLSKMAKEGKLDAVIGREKEIDELVQILSKRKKNNPVLVGESGVGKTAIVEGLAIRILKKEVDRWLFNKRIIELNFTTIVAGTKFRGEFEQRMEELIKEIIDNPDIIVFIDELHNVVGAGGASGSMDASNIIKPALSRGEMSCIGATTLDEYKKYIESDGALERRFQKVFVAIPTKEETYFILKQIKAKYEDYHNVIYSDEVLKHCVDLTDRYITYRNFPDKAIDVMDEIGARVKLNNTVIPAYIKVFEEELKEIQVKKREAANTQNYEDAAKFRDKERALQEKIEREILKWEANRKDHKVAVSINDIAFIISTHTGIPVNKLSNTENDKLAAMEKMLKSKVIGQDEAVTKVCEAIQRSRVGIQDPNKPIASLLFLGSTGVGKTELAKALADYVFSSEESFIRFDMSEFGEKFSVSQLIGAPPGYVGHEDKGQLTERVKNRPYSLILLDEIEKAHPDIFNILLQVLDDGILTDATGKEVNFKNTIIIMTSNIGTGKIFNDNKLGFSSAASKGATQDISNTILQELKKFFRPELINRIDEKIVFKQLTPEDVLLIVDIELEKLLSRMKDKGYELSVMPSVKKYLCEIGYDKDFGARPLKRAITTHVENLIAKAILNKEIKEKDVIKLSFDKKENKIFIKK